MYKSYSELSKLKTFESRFEYLKTNSSIGVDTFGCNRYLNQILYKSKEWKEFRRRVILRDSGCDLGLEGHEIGGLIVIHHINPITREQVLNRDPVIFDMNNVVSCSLETHNAIHFGDLNSIKTTFAVRTKNDTCPWKN